MSLTASSNTRSYTTAILLAQNCLALNTPPSGDSPDSLNLTIQIEIIPLDNGTHQANIDGKNIEAKSFYISDMWVSNPVDYDGDGYYGKITIKFSVYSYEDSLYIYPKLMLSSSGSAWTTVHSWGPINTYTGNNGPFSVTLNGYNTGYYYLRIYILDEYNNYDYETTSGRYPLEPLSSDGQSSGGSSDVGFLAGLSAFFQEAANSLGSLLSQWWFWAIIGGLGLLGLIAFCLAEEYY